jgi:prepilin peptidase CpaA
VFVQTHSASFLFVLLLTAAAAVVDLRKGVIPNRLLLLGLGMTLAFHLTVVWAAAGQPLLAVLLTCVAGAAAAALVPIVLYVSKGLGGGDLKLLTLTGAALGPAAGVEVEAYAFALGSLFAFGYLAYRGTLFRTLGRSLLLLAPTLPSRRQKPAAMPDPLLQFRFGPAIFAGALLTAARHFALS